MVPVKSINSPQPPKLLQITILRHCFECCLFFVWPWCLGRAAVCDCGTPWTFLLPFFVDARCRLIHISSCLLSYCPPPFRRKARVHSIRLSVVRGAWFVVRVSEFKVGTLWAQLLLQFLINPSEILQVSLSCSEDVHVLFTESLNYFFYFFSHF